MNNMLLRIQMWYLLQKINVKRFGVKGFVFSHMEHPVSRFKWAFYVALGLGFPNAAEGGGM